MLSPKLYRRPNHNRFLAEFLLGTYLVTELQLLMHSFLPTPWLELSVEKDNLFSSEDISDIEVEVDCSFLVLQSVPCRLYKSVSHPLAHTNV